MEQIKVTAVFDIGKTNKKFFLFDKNFAELNTMDSEFSELTNIYYSQLLGDLFALKAKNINTYLVNIDSKRSNPFDKIMEEIKELV